MRPNEPKRKIFAGEVSLGTFVFEFASSGIGKIIGAAGAEFVIYDMEHSGFSVETVRKLIASTPDSVAPFVRAPNAESHFISRLMDVGAMGLMVPLVGSAEVAASIVRAAKYLPEGQRGCAFGVAHDQYDMGDIQATMQSSNRELLIMPQIETVEGLESIEEIAAVDGVDVLWLGHFDLSNSMGIPGQFDHPDFISASQRIADVAHKHGKKAGYMAFTTEAARQYLDFGYDIIAYGGDIWLYQAALRDGIANVRSALPR